MAVMAALFGFLLAPLTALTIVKDGQPQALVAIPSKANEHEALAAKDLAEFVEKMSGAKLETTAIEAGGVDAFIKDAKAKGRVPIVLGSIAQDRLAKAHKGEPVRGAFALQARDGAILIAGAGEGTSYGVLELLEQAGCRWFMPGDLGTVVPSLKTIDVKEQLTVQAPSFPSRWFQMPDRDWQKRVRCGGDVFAGGHGIHAPPFAKDKVTGEYGSRENAEYYSLVGGKRVARQHCVSNPRLIQFIVERVKQMRKAGKGPVIGMGPNDGGGFCECANCRALDGGDFDPFSNEVAVTDRYIWFFNEVLKGVEADYPDTKLGFYTPAQHELSF